MYRIYTCGELKFLAFWFVIDFISFFPSIQHTFIDARIEMACVHIQSVLVIEYIQQKKKHNRDEHQ